MANTHLTQTGAEVQALLDKVEGIEAGAQVNDIEKIKVNGTEQAVVDKEVDITVPTSLSNLSDDTTHRLVTDTEKAAWDAKADEADIPDVSSFITKSVDDLVNYYLKSETYTKAEVQALIGAIQSFHYEIYASTAAVTNPQGNVLYLIGPTGSGEDKYEEYVYDSTKATPWVKIGDTSIDLSSFVTTSDLDTALSAYTTSADLSDLLDAKQDVINDLDDIRDGAAAGATAYQKPNTGIPAADLASGVIPTVPTISTDIASDATSDTKTASPKAVKTYADTKYTKPAFGIPESDLAGEVKAKLKETLYISSLPTSDITSTDDLDDVISRSTLLKLAEGEASTLIYNQQIEYGMSESDFAQTECVITKASKIAGDRNNKCELTFVLNGYEYAITADYNTRVATVTVTAVQDITNKADKVSGATNGHLAALDGNGNLMDSGKSASDFGTYSKPSGGIPKTDLASAVQTSLGKADTALQSFTETDPTVPSWAKASSKPSYDYSEIDNTPTIPDAVEANPTVPSGATPTALNNLKVGDDYYSVPQGGESSPVLTTETYQYLPRPKYAEFWFTGTLPTDTTDTRTPTSLSFIMKVGGKAVLSADCELSIQGHGSTAYNKKGYTFDILNANGDAASLKFGDLPAADSFHLKAYATDMTHTRGLAGAKIWRQMLDILPYQENLVTNRALSLVATQKKNALYWADAKFSEDGFPCAFYLNGSFHGLYTLKLKKGKPNYALNDSDTDNIFLDAASSNYTAYLSQSFNYSDWELKSPKITGYTPNGQITDAGVLADIQSLWAFTTDLSNKYTQHADYIVLNHWLLWYILCELICHKDTSGNNYELVTWDGTHWSMLPYDMDLTLGLDAWDSYTIKTSVTGWQVGTQPGSGDTTFWSNFRTLYYAELSTLYTLLRRSVLTIGNLSNIFKGEADCIPRDIYNADYQEWGTIWSNGIPTLQQTLSVLKSRLDYLDSQWLNPTAQPLAGMQPGVRYDLGTLTGSVTFTLATAMDASQGNEYDFTFDSGSTAAVPTWPASVTSWTGNCIDSETGEPDIAASKHYKVSIVNGYGYIAESEISSAPTPSPSTPLENLTARIWMGANTYCQTDITPANTDYIKIKFALSNLSSGDGKELIGYRKYNNSDEDSFMLEFDSYGLGYMGLKVKMAGTYWASATGATDDTRYVVEAKASGVTCSPSLGTFTSSSYTFSQAGPLALGGLAFANNTVGMAYAGKAIFGVEIYGSDDTLKHRLIPQSDLTFLDEVTQTSYPVTGSNVSYDDD